MISYLSLAHTIARLAEVPNIPPSLFLGTWRHGFQDGCLMVDLGSSPRCPWHVECSQRAFQVIKVPHKTRTEFHVHDAGIRGTWPSRLNFEVWRRCRAPFRGLAGDCMVLRHRASQERRSCRRIERSKTPDVAYDDYVEVRTLMGRCCLPASEVSGHDAGEK